MEYITGQNLFYAAFIALMVIYVPIIVKAYIKGRKPDNDD
jgi:hypothetical protein